MGEMADKIKGKAKQAAGRLSDDDRLEAEGKVDETKGKAEGAFDDAKTDVKRALRNDEEDSDDDTPR
jgi:uncharacterized protein YjbJ (UPF0337 family)